MHLWRILHFVVEHLVVWLLVVIDKLVDILINLNRSVYATVFVLKLHVVLARLFSVGFNLD